MKRLLVLGLTISLLLGFTVLSHGDKIITLDTTWLHSVEIMIVPLNSGWTAELEIKGCAIDDFGVAKEPVIIHLNRKDLPIAIRDQLDAFLTRASREINKRGVNEDVPTLPELE